MKKIFLLVLPLVLVACTAIPATEPIVPVTGDVTPTRPAGNPQTGTVEANGITIAYESFGSPEDETILLIGGTGQQLVGWPMELVAGLVERGFRVVRFDNRDVGLSTRLTDAGLPDPAAVSRALQEGKPAPVPYTLRDMAEDTAGLLDALGIERAHLVGASMGGAIAQWVAIDHPGRVLSLTTIAADSGNPEIPAIAKPEAFAGVPLQPTTLDRAAFIDWQIKTFQVLAGPTYPIDEATLGEWAERDFDRGFDPAGLVRQQTAILADYFDPDSERRNNLAKITAPTVIVHGTEDPLVPMASAEDLAARIPNAELRVIPGLGHFIPPALVAEIIDAVVAAVERATQPPTADNDLVGSTWQLSSFGPVGATNPVIGNAAITLGFEPDGQAGGHGGCNSYGGAYTVENESLKFEEVTGTLIACADPEITNQEGEYLQALRTASRFAIDGNTLTIWYQDEGGVLKFRRTPAPTVEPPGGNPPGEDAERIRFPEGDTSIEIFADVPARGSDSYILQAEQGQIMSVALASPNNDVFLEIAGEDGVPLKRYQNGPPSWTGQLPATQDYFIRAVSVGADTSYTLHVWVEPVSSPTRERVAFESGTNSATRSGALPEGGVKEYVLAGSAGQSMHIQTVGYSAPVGFSLTGPTGAPVLNSPAEPQPSDVYIFTAQVLLPDDGDYVLRLSVPPGAGATRYDVAFTITNDPLPTPSAGEPPERVSFEPGADSAEHSGLLPSGSALKQYVLTAQAGQTMTVEVTRDDVALSLTITTPGGIQRIPETFPADNGFRVSHEFTLTESGDYLVTLTKADHTPSTYYTVDFMIK